ncbi:MAG: hypothetical protein K6G89_02730 [Clostridia bacterium]|nr:hypothetical protein [Clostridia bacterium]
MLKSRIVDHNGSPAPEVEGVVIPPMAFTAHAHTRDKDYLRKLGEAGIKMFFLICDPEWLYDGAFEMLQKDAEVLLEAVPDAKIFLRLGVHPSVDWLKNHPDEIMRYQDGRTVPVRVITESYGNGFYPGMYALYSEAWREEASKHVIGFLKDLEATPLAEHVIGVFLAGGNTSEWYPSNRLTIHKGGYMGFEIPESAPCDLYGDFSPAFRKAFSTYLYDRYGSQEALRKAWNDPSANIEDPHIPDMFERSFIHVDSIVSRFPVDGSWPDHMNENNVGSFLNLEKYQCTADFYRAFHVGAADSIIYFAKEIKKHYPDTLVGAFYGYFGCLDYYNMCMCAGALKMLDSGYVDMTACPNVYIERQPGGYSSQRVMQDSFRLRNRLFFSEDDTRTICERDRAGARDYMEQYDIADSINTMKRDFGRDICQDISAWWFDQYDKGRFNHPDLLALMKRQQEIAADFYAKDRTKHNDAAFFYDEESVHITSEPTLFQMIELNRCLEIPRTGIPADFYYHNDIARSDLPDYKLYVFVNCFSLTKKEREDIKAKVRRQGKTALFIYGQGFADPEGSPKLSESYISDLTGMNIKRIDMPSYAKFKIDPNGILGADCDPGTVYGQPDRAVKDGCAMHLDPQTSVAFPLFVCDDADAEPAATLCKEKKPAISFKRENGHMTFFSAAKWLTADIYRAIGRAAGCHVYSDSSDFVFANERYLTIHAASTGTKTIRFKSPCDPFEVYQKKYFGRSVTEFELKMVRGETLMFCLDC